MDCTTPEMVLPSYQLSKKIKSNMPATIRSITTLLCQAHHHNIISDDVDVMAVNDVVNYLTYLQEGE